MRKYIPKTLILLAFVLIGSISVFSQPLLDSLFLELANSVNDTNKIIILNKITREYRIDEPGKAFQFNQKAMKLAKKLNYIPGIARSYDLLGTINRYRNNNVKALDNYLKALEFYKQLNDTISIAHTYNFLGIIYDQRNGDQDKALNYYSMALKLFRQINDYEGLAMMINNIGVIYREINQDSLALEYLEESFEINKMINRNRGMGKACMNIGNIYLDRGFSRMIKDSSLNMAKDSSLNMAKIYYYKSLDYFLKDADYVGVAIAYYNIGNNYIFMNQFDSANFYLLKSKDLANKYSFLGRKGEIVLALSKMYIKQKKHEMANKYLLELNEIQDTLLAERMNNKILKLEKHFNLEQEIKEQEFKLIEKSRMLRINILQKYILLIIATFIIIFGWVLINRKKIKIRYFNEILETKNNELVSYAIYILQKNDLVHEFRNQLFKLEKRLKEEANKKVVKEIINSLIFKIAISEDIEKFRDKLRVISETFYNKLEHKYPDLTDKEKHLASLLRLDLSSKQIGIIFDIATESVVTSRHRLRKKIGLSTDDNLVDFFKKI